MSGSWYQLIGIRDEARASREADKQRELLACPNDGEPYSIGIDGERFCRFDGYRPRR